MGDLSWVVAWIDCLNGPQPLEDASSESGISHGRFHGMRRSLWMTGGPHFGLGGAWPDAGWSDFAGFSLKFVSRAKGRNKVMGPVFPGSECFPMFCDDPGVSGIPYEIVQFMRVLIQCLELFLGAREVNALLLVSRQSPALG